MSTKMIAITGRSGSGKSRVAAYYRSLGYEVCDADLVAREIVQTDPDCLALLCSRFGSDILNEDGSLNRRLLANKAFATPEGTQALTDITHPAIIRSILRQCEACTKEIFFVDGAVIVGHELQKFCQKIILVSAGDELAVQRICSRDGISPEMAQRRLDAQTPLAVLRAAADYEIENTATEHQLLQQADTVLRQITDKEPYEEKTL